MSGPSTLLQHREKFTAVTPSKPNFLPIGSSRFAVVAVVVQFILVMVLVIPSVIVREAMV